MMAYLIKTCIALFEFAVRDIARRIRGGLKGLYSGVQTLLYLYPVPRVEYVMREVLNFSKGIKFYLKTRVQYLGKRFRTSK